MKAAAVEVDDESGDGLTPWLRACVAAALFVVDPVGIGGVVVRARSGPVRDRWLAMLRSLLPPERPLRRMPLQIPDGRLLGGLDLSATLRSGRPVMERGLLAEVDGGILMLPMAERLEAGVAGRLAAVIDRASVQIQRDGIDEVLPSRFGFVALDEGEGDDERMSASLADRAGLWLDLDDVSLGESEAAADLFSAEQLSAAAAAWAEADFGGSELRVGSLQTSALEALCGGAWALGVDSLRAPLQALRVARAAAVLDGRQQLLEQDVALAAQLVLAPRATRFPDAEAADDHAEPETSEADPQAAEDRQPEPSEADLDQSPSPDEEEHPASAEDDAPDADDLLEPDAAASLEDQVLAAVAAVLPQDLLAQLRSAPLRRAKGDGGRSGAWRQGTRGRPAGIRRGRPERGMRLNVVETLRAAAAWQPLRRRQRSAGPQRGSAPRVEVRAEDFRVTRHRQPTETVTLFVVDASGSAALHRLAEAKGAVELLLADCYVRRDKVALIAFRGEGAEVLLPPTRSLLRAKRSLAGLPGGGGTPLASGLDAAHDLADEIRRRGATPVIVLLTDGQANVARDGRPGRSQAEADAAAAARRLAVSGHQVLLIDTGPRRRAGAQDIAGLMGARFLPLPQADARGLSAAVRAVLPA